MNDSLLLQARDLSVRAGGRPLLRGVSFGLGPGQCLSVLGESGAGKSLMAQAIMGTLPAALQAGGSVAIEGRETPADTPVARCALWGRRLAMLPQEPTVALEPLLRVLPQVEDVYRHVRGVRQGEARRAASDALAAAGLFDAQHGYPWQLSGGMAQRAAACVALAGGARILLVDEPTKGLDAHWRAQTLALLRRTLQDGGCVVAITHDLELAQGLGGEVMVLRDGEVIERGPAEQVLQRPQHAFTQRLIAAHPSNWPRLPGIDCGEVVLQGQGLAKSRGGRLLFEDVDLALHRGERLVLQGPSGAGKTTLGNVLCGLVDPDRGSIRLAPHLSRTARQKLYQDPALSFPPRIPLETALRDVAALHTRPWREVQERLERLRVGGELLRRRPAEVSGGELQRIALARALAARPALLVADEPTSRLDPITQQEAIEELVRSAAEVNAALVLVTHEEGIAHAVGGRSMQVGAREAAAPGMIRNLQPA